LVAVVIKEMGLKICVFFGDCEILYLALFCGLESASAKRATEDPLLITTMARERV
jgi:hypothetical protein